MRLKFETQKVNKYFNDFSRISLKYVTLKKKLKTNPVKVISVLYYQSNDNFQ